MNIVGENTLLAGRLLRDSPTGSLSLIDCMDTVWAPVFPWVHHNFAVASWFRLDDDAPENDVPVAFRIVRTNDDGEERVISTIDGEWSAGTRRARIATSFQVLHLVQAGRLRFRVDVRVGEGDWQSGSTATLDVCEAAMPEDERKTLASLIANVQRAATDR